MIKWHLIEGIKGPEGEDVQVLLQKSVDKETDKPCVQFVTYLPTGTEVTATFKVNTEEEVDKIFDQIVNDPAVVEACNSFYHDVYEDVEGWESKLNYSAEAIYNE